MKNLTNEDLEAIMVTALEGGINYWIGEAHSKNGMKDGEILSDHIGNGGTIIMVDLEDEDETYELDRAKIDKALPLYFEWAEGFDPDEDRLDEMDADHADAFIQFAIFGEITFG